MPSSLDEKLQDLMKPSPQHPKQQAPPSQEALDFLESLLSGTEPSTASVPRKSTGPSVAAKTTAQIVDNANRLKTQADAARRRRHGTNGPDVEPSSTPSHRLSIGESLKLTTKLMSDAASMQSDESMSSAG